MIVPFEWKCLSYPKVENVNKNSWVYIEVALKCFFSPHFMLKKSYQQILPPWTAQANLKPNIKSFHLLHTNISFERKKWEFRGIAEYLQILVSRDMITKIDSI